MRCALRRRAADAGSPRGVQRGAHQTPQHHRHDDRRPHHAGHELLRQSAGRNPQPRPPRARRHALRELLRLQRHLGTLAGLHPHGQVQPRERIHGQFAHLRRRPADLPETPARRRLPDGDDRQVAPQFRPAGIRFLEHPRGAGRVLFAAVRRERRGADRTGLRDGHHHRQGHRIPRTARQVAALRHALLPQGPAPQLDARAASSGHQRR